MKVYNKEKTQILTEYDLSKGYLSNDYIDTIYHEEIVYQPKQSHYEQVGNNYIEIVDKEEISSKEAYYDQEEVRVYIPYTTEELNQKTIEDLKWWFDNYYAEHEQKYRRLHTMHKLCDDGSNPYNKLMELYEQAEINRKEIQRLENE